MKIRVKKALVEQKSLLRGVDSPWDIFYYGDKFQAYVLPRNCFDTLEEYNQHLIDVKNKPDIFSRVGYSQEFKTFMIEIYRRDEQENKILLFYAEGSRVIQNATFKTLVFNYDDIYELTKDYVYFLKASFALVNEALELNIEYLQFNLRICAR